MLSVGFRAEPSSVGEGALRNREPDMISSSSSLPPETGFGLDGVTLADARPLRRLRGVARSFAAVAPPLRSITKSSSLSSSTAA